MRFKLGLLLLVLASPASAKPPKAARDREAFDRLVTQLEQEPGNEKALKRLFHLVGGMRPQPKPAFDAGRIAAGADEDLKQAKTKQDFADAARSFQRALISAPWLVPLYDKLSRAQQKSGDPKSALASLKIFLLANPDLGSDSAMKKRLAALKAAAAKTDAKEKAAAREKEETPRPAWASASWTATSVFQPPIGPASRTSFPVQFSQQGGAATATRTINGLITPYLRAAVTKTGASNWEYFAGDPFPGSCRSGWQAVGVEADPQVASLSLRLPAYVLNHCEKDGGYETLTLTR